VNGKPLEAGKIQVQNLISHDFKEGLPQSELRGRTSELLFLDIFGGQN
jgi:hypothetical protein